jgi:hypothetical protein
MRPVLAVSRELSSRRLDAERLHDRPIIVAEHDELVNEWSEERPGIVAGGRRAIWVRCERFSRLTLPGSTAQRTLPRW